MHKQFKTSKAAVFCRVFGSMPTSWPLGHVGDMRITGVDAQPRPESCWAQGWSVIFVMPKLMQAFPFCCFAPLPSNFYNPLPDSEDSQMILLQFVALLSFCPCPLHVCFFPRACSPPLLILTQGIFGHLLSAFSGLEVHGSRCHNCCCGSHDHRTVGF